MNLKFLTMAICSFLMLSNIAFAVLGTPHAFYGTVTLNGSPAPDGTIVTARIGNTEVASTTSIDGKYDFYVADDSSSRSGEEILFFVDGVSTGQVEYFVTAGVTELDLSVTISTTTTTTGGSSTGGGASTTTTTTTTNETTETTETTSSGETVCQERWTCSEWSECVSGIQTRECSDENDCGTNSREPFSSQPCTSKESGVESPAGPTGFFLFTTSDVVIAAGIGSLAVVSVILVLFLRRKPKPVPVVVVG